MSIIAAGNTTTTALVQTADTTGNLVFNTGGANTTALTLTNAQAATFAGAVTIAGATTQTGNASFSNVTISGTTTGTGNITTTGSIGAGTASPAQMLSVGSTGNRGNVKIISSDGGGISIQTGGGGGGSGTNISFYDADTSYAAKIESSKVGSNTADLVFSTASGSASFTEKMRLDSAGNLLVGQTSASLALKSAFTTSGAAVGNVTMRNSANTAGKYFNIGATSDAIPYFVVYDQSSVGVYIAPGGTSWTAGSDETTKDIIEPISDAVNKVSSLRSVIGKYKTDEEGTRRSFLIAQDVQKVLPEAVTVSPAGTLGLQYQDMIPLLVAAVKELNAKVDAQTKKITDLEEQVLNLGTK